MNIRFVPAWGRLALILLTALVSACGIRSASAQTAAGRAFEFDGTDDYVSKTPTTTLTGNYTVEAWLCPKNATKIMSFFGTRGGFDFGLDIKIRDGNSIRADIGTGAAWLTTTASAPLNYTVGNWCHVALVVTSTNYTFYTNGVMASTATYAAGTPMIYNPQRPIILGRYASYLNAEFWQGTMDEVRIWSVARSAAQIQAAYNLRADGSEAGLEVLWHLDEFESRHVLDSTGHGYDATTFGGVTFVNSTAPIVPGVAGRALAFDGVNQYVAIPGFGNIAPTNEVTVEFWAFTQAPAGQSAFMLDPDQNGNRFQAHINYGTEMYWDFGNIVGPGRIHASAPQNSVTNWVHYALVASQTGNFMRIYTNGVLFASQSVMDPFERGNYELRIGGSTGNFYGGRLDDFRVWSKARTEAEVQADYKKTLTGSEANLVVYYDFDSETGTVLTNRATATGAALNGTLMNSPAWVPSTAPIAYRPAVTTSADTGPGSLRYAMIYSPPGTTITIPASLSGQTVTLNGGPLLMDRNLTVDGTGSGNGLRLEGFQNRWPVMRVLPGVIATVNALTFAKGGGTNDGAGIHNLGILTLNNCTISENLAFFHGSGIFNGGGATLNVNQCTISGNVGFGGGGIFNQGTVNLDQSTIAANVDDFGGGGVENQGIFSLKNSIIAGNLPEDVLNKTAFNAVAVNIVSNLVNDGGTISGTSLRNGNPLFGPLGNNGGPTRTHALGNGSAARNVSVGSTFPTDQRGAAVDVVRDLGAYETGSAINYTTWAFESFPAGTPSQLTAPDADYDQDGRNNAEEYARLTDPAVPDAPPTLTLTVNAAVTVTTNVFRLRPSNKDLTYTLDYSLSVTSGWFNVLRIDNINGNHSKDSLISTNIVNGVITVIDTYDGVNTAFYRLGIQYQPPTQ